VKKALKTAFFLAFLGILWYNNIKEIKKKGADENVK